jgi:hypothetical protein
LLPGGAGKQAASGKGELLLILALNETRKTLVASRLHVVQAADRGFSRKQSTNILPGDAVWVEADRIDTSAIPDTLDLLFLDADRRVLAAVADVRPGGGCPQVHGAVGVLELAPGTIRLSQTEAGDLIVFESIVAANSQAAAVRVSRS